MQLLKTLSDHEDRVWDVTWSPCGKLLATCGADKGVRIWQVEIGSEADIKESLDVVCVGVLDDAQSRTIRSCEFSKSGRYLATSSFDSTTVIWEKTLTVDNTVSWSPIATLEGHEHEVKCASWSHNDKYLATCSRDKSAWIWAVPDSDDKSEDTEWEAISVLNGHAQDVKFVVWSPDKEVLYTASYDDTIKVWAEDVDDWACFDTLTGHTNTVWGLAFNDDGSKLASCSQDKSVRIWESKEVESGFKWECIETIDSAHDRTIFSIDWKGEFLATAGADDAICIYKYNGKLIRLNKLQNAHETDVNCIRWNPRIKGLCASGSDDEQVKLWFVPEARS